MRVCMYTPPPTIYHTHTNHVLFQERAGNRRTAILGASRSVTGAAYAAAGSTVAVGAVRIYIYINKYKYKYIVYSLYIYSDVVYRIYIATY